MAAEMRPISVVRPVLTTTPTPRPRATVVDWKAMLCRSPMATRLWPCVLLNLGLGLGERLERVGGGCRVGLVGVLGGG